MTGPKEPGDIEHDQTFEEDVYKVVHLPKSRSLQVINLETLVVEGIWNYFFEFWAVQDRPVSERIT